MAWGAGHAAKALEVLLGRQNVGQNSEPALASAIAAIDASVGVHQHHDGLTGTDLEAVAANYANMIVRFQYKNLHFILKNLDFVFSRILISCFHES